MKYKLPAGGIYAITDERLSDHHGLLAAVEVALANGISLLQYRNKQGSPAERLSQAAALVELCHLYDVPCLINDDIDLCLQVDADGVHLGQQDTAIAGARERLGNRIIGVSCHDSLDLARGAQDSGASYVAFGRFFTSHSKPEAAPARLSVLSEARASLSVPIVAIGGINAENGASLLRAGADILAVIHGLFGSPDVAGNTQRLVDVINSNQKARNENRD